MPDRLWRPRHVGLETRDPGFCSRILGVYSLQQHCQLHVEYAMGNLDITRLNRVELVSSSRNPKDVIEHTYVQGVEQLLPSHPRVPPGQHMQISGFRYHLGLFRLY